MMFLGGRGTFHSSWAREVFVTEPGDHVDLGSLFLATQRERKEEEGDDGFRKWRLKHPFCPKKQIPQKETY